MSKNESYIENYPKEISRFRVHKKNFTEVNESKSSTNYGNVQIVIEKKSRGGRPERKCVLKETIHSLEDDPTFQSFTREVEIFALYPHPAIVPFVGFAESDNKKGRIYLELMDKGSLKDEIDRNSGGTKLDYTRKLIITYGVAAAMEYLHSKKVIHRDLKPGNILLDNDLYPYLTDFGTSKNLDANSNPQISITQTTDYTSSPEFKLQPATYKDALPIDVYSFAMTMYHFWTGENPCRSLGEFRFSQFIENGNRPDFKSSTPIPIQQLIDKCWQQCPESRLTFTQVVDMLEGPEFACAPGCNQPIFAQYVSRLKPSRPSATPKSDIQIAREYMALGDKRMAELLYSKAAQTSPEAAFELAQYMYKGEFKYHTHKEIDALYQQAVDGQYLEAIRTFSMINYNGYLSTSKVEKAVKCFKLGSQLNDPCLMYYYSQMKERGIYTEKDVDEAMRLLQQSANLSYVDAQVSLGLHLLKGYNIPKNEQLAAQYFKMAADLGDAASQLYTALLYITSSDIYTAYLTASLKQSNLDACAYQGELLYINNNDVAKALEWINPAVSGGSLLAMLAVGNICEKYPECGDSQYFYQHASNHCHCLDNIGFITPIPYKKYHCDTCNLDMCEGCAKHCHRGHQIQLIGEERCFTCGCGSRGFNNHCNCEYFGEQRYPQHLYQCLTCSPKNGTEYICKGCIEYCHQGHQIVDCGIVKDEHSYCHCGMKRMTNKSICKLLP